ncbi:MAG TPA: beta-glucosidase [Verrucomicrobia bacterium]|nr:beta-glucosidase [Verrucomicrobiota bacterium]
MKQVTRISLLALTLVSLCASPSAADNLEQRKGHREVFRKEAAALVAKMTLDEKASLLSMQASAIGRLNIPAHDWWSEALHGVARNGQATQFPQSICMASTWNPELIEAMASAIGDEARAKHHSAPNRVKRYQGLTIWSPTVNLARDPRWGRNEETYGEDPWLTSCMAVAFVKGLQGDHPKYLKTVATVKHFICNNTEHNRISTIADVPEQFLRDYFMIPYRAAVREAGVQSIMTAYNGINGVPCSANKWLVTDVLRGEWRFSGTVVTDVGAPRFLTEKHNFSTSNTEAASMMIKAGIDVISDGREFGGYAKNALQNGMLAEDEVNRAVIQSLATRLELGQVLQADDNPYVKIPESVVGSDEHCGIARKIAQQGIVLLKNKNNLLPVDTKKIKTIIVTGPFADNAQLGGYSGKPTHKAVTPYEGIKAAVGADVEVILRPWKEDTMEPIPTSNLRPVAGSSASGLTAEYFAGTTCSGIPKTTRVDENVDFIWPKPLENIDPDIPQPQFAVRWTGQLLPEKTGAYLISGRCDDGVRIWLNGAMIVDDWSSHGVRSKVSDTLHLEAGKPYELRMEYFDGGDSAEAHLEWIPPKGAVEVVAEKTKSSTLVVYVCGFSTQHADEGRDLMNLNLPDKQLADLRIVYKTYPNTLVVFNGGTVVTDGWVYDSIPAIMHAWYPGQEGGHALADLVLGRLSPSGRMPVTTYMSTEDLPDIDDYDLAKGRTYMYCKKPVRYPFGHGLSYATFKYGELLASKNQCSRDDVVVLSLDVSNTGSMEGDEIVQLYVKELGSDDAPMQQLRMFKRVSIPAGGTASVRLSLPVQRLERWNSATKGYEVRPGEYELRVGSSSADIRQIVRVNVK